MEIEDDYEEEEDARPRDEITGRKLSNPLNKAKLSKYEMDRIFAEQEMEEENEKDELDLDEDDDI